MKDEPCTSVMLETWHKWQTLFCGVFQKNPGHPVFVKLLSKPSVAQSLREFLCSLQVKVDPILLISVV